MFFFSFQMPFGMYEGIPASFGAIVASSTAMLLRKSYWRRLAISVAVLVIMVATQFLLSGVRFDLGKALMMGAAVAFVFVQAWQVIANYDREQVFGLIIFWIKVGIWLNLVIILGILAARYSIGFESTSISRLNASYIHYLGGLPRVSGLFSEPSHLAVALSPMIYLMVCHWRWALDNFGIKTLAAVLAMLLLCPSGTLFANLAIVFVARMFLAPKQFGLTLIFLLLCAAAMIVLDIDSVVRFLPEEVASKVYGVLDTLKFGMEDWTLNLSSRLYVRGLAVAWYTVLNEPLGFGIGNMAESVGYVLYSSGEDFFYLGNLQDGTSAHLKLITETGWIGLSLVVLVVAFFIKAHVSKAPAFYSAILFLGVASIVRSSGYFDGLYILVFVFIALSPSIKTPSARGRALRPEHTG